MDHTVHMKRARHNTIEWNPLLRSIPTLFILSNYHYLYLVEQQVHESNNGFSENKIIDIPLWHSYGSSNMSVFCCFFSGTASYSRGYTGQKFAFTTSLSWHRLGPWLHPFWLHCSQQFYRVPNIKAVFVPSCLIHGWGVHFGLYCRRRLVQL